MAESKQRRRPGGGNASANGFKNLDLSEDVYRGIVRMGFRMPTPVQRKALPVILTGADTVVMARTGSGKTIAFLVPLLQKLLHSETTRRAGTAWGGVRGLILSPTRELSLQTLRVLKKLAADTGLTAIGIHGGEGMEKQFNLLASKPDVIVATPGRLAHHLSEIPDFNLHRCQMTILDEADRLIEMGFSSQIREICKTLPESNQKVLLSATMPRGLIEFTKGGFCVDPTMVRLDSEATVSAELRIAFITCRSLDKDAALLHVLDQIQTNNKKLSLQGDARLTLIFAATRHHVEYLSCLLEAAGISNTVIYGTLDHEARKANLAAFKSGQTPVLIVTDVAARGIDVPLIDHVIHYHFASSPKLFVHRSGRAARAGRIGYCWGLVEPDELPYMMDLHLFLGRRPSTGLIEEEDGTTKELTYTLDEMTPDMVHYGSVPELIMTQQVENVERIVKSELSGSQQAESLRSLRKVCTNAMKQYRRTRTEASREGVRRAKAILEGRRLETGQRVGGGAIPTHPLLRGMERQSQDTTSPASGLTGAQNVQKRQEFLRALSGFRPKESVFEAFATGKNKDTGVVSHVDKGRTTSKTKNDSSAALTAMREMRRQMRIAHDKGSALIVAGSEKAEEASDDKKRQEEPDLNQDKELLNPHESVVSVLTAAARAAEGKRRLSKAERRRLKKNPNAVIDTSAKQEPTKKAAMMRGADFRDPAFFIENDFTSNSEEARRSRQVEAAMQPSTAAVARGSMGKALRIEEVMLDIVGDENDELVKKQRMMRWDKSKRKYVQTTVGSELSGDSKSKKMRLESGQLVNSEKMKLGELYAKWQKRTNRSVGRNGVFDDADGADDGAAPASFGGRKAKGKRSRNADNHGSRGGDEVKSSIAIKKEREKKHNMQIKNMKKSDRRSLERKQREGKTSGLGRGFKKSR